MVELVVRLVFSLAVIIGMLMLLTRFSAKRFRGGTDALVRVVHRQALSRGSAVAVVTVGSRVLVIGTTDQQVQLLTELEPGELELPVTVPVAVPAEPVDRAETEPVRWAETEPVVETVGLDALFGPYTPRHAAGEGDDTAPSAGQPSDVAALSVARSARAADGALAGSVLSAQTWKQAFAAATNRARDAS